MNICLVGCGYWGKNIARNLYELGALHTICDTSSDRLDVFRDKYNINYETDLNIVLSNSDINGVVLATPAETHYKLGKLVIAAGKDLYIEKPLATSVEHAEELVDLANKKGCILMVGHVLHYHPAVVKMKQLIDQGELGRIQAIYSNRMSLGKIRREENILWSFAPHDISLIQSITKELPVRVFASGGYYLHEKIADTTLSVMEYASGIRAHIYVSWLHPFKEQRLVIIGSRKMLVFNDVEKENKLLLYPHEINWENGAPVPDKKDAVSIPFEKGEPLKQELQAFLDSIDTRLPPLTDGKEGLETLKVLFSCQQSMENGTITIPKTKTDERCYIHPTAVVGDPYKIGNGTKIWHFSHVMNESELGKNCNIGQNVFIASGVKLGDNVKVQNNVSIYSGVELEDNVFCGPSVVFTNINTPRSAVNRKGKYVTTIIKTGATLGANSTIICGNTLNKFSFIGAGAVVTKDVPAYALMVGNPAIRVGWMCECGIKLSDELKCVECGAAYHQVDDELERKE